MMDAKPTIRLYYVPQSFPCGPQSACCGPSGQTEEELRTYQNQLQEALPGVELQTIDLTRRTNLGRDLPALKLYNTFGPSACPVITVNGEVVSMGIPSMPELVGLVKAKLHGARPAEQAAG